eukprot:2471443-Rhodomonas_salina.2
MKYDTPRWWYKSYRYWGLLCLIWHSRPLCLRHSRLAPASTRTKPARHTLTQYLDPYKTCPPYANSVPDILQ